MKSLIIGNINKGSSYSDLESYREKRKVKGKKSHIWTSAIPFFVDSRLNHSLIIRALREIQSETCVRFYEVKKISKMSGIQYYPGDVCASHLGKLLAKKFQKIFIAKTCETIGGIQHETLHALGVDHEHNRIDRDHYVSILYENIDKSSAEDFRISSLVDSNTFGLPYDYGSIMHYTMYASSKNGKPTIVPKHYIYKNTIGHVRKLSFIDIKTINLLYCMNKCSFKIDCYKGSYQDSNFCFRCKCVDGFVGNDCNHFVMNIPSCGMSTHVAKRSPQVLKSYGIKNCYYHLMTRKYSKIIIKIFHIIIYPFQRRYCWPEDSLEIKYWDDKTVTGARFCGIRTNIGLLYTHPVN
uniref:Metalloendopeptidase n=1 Tax=Strongyloides papillosus TaxID=174720 RepID=A0A0N5C2U5_STREA